MLLQGQQRNEVELGRFLVDVLYEEEEGGEEERERERRDCSVLLQGQQRNEVNNNC